MKTSLSIPKDLLKNVPEFKVFAELEAYERLGYKSQKEWKSLFVAYGTLTNGKYGYMLFSENNEYLELNNIEKQLCHTQLGSNVVWDYIEKKYKVEIDSFNNDWDE